MKIRFKVDQAEAFRRGVNSPNQIVSLEVDPALLTERERELIGTHLLETDEGINVVYDPEHASWEYAWPVPIGGHPAFDLVEAAGRELCDLLDALNKLGPQVNRTPEVVQSPTKPDSGQGRVISRSWR